MQVFTFALADDRRENHDAAVIGQGHDLVYHLANGLSLQLYIVLRAVGLAYAGEE